MQNFHDSVAPYLLENVEGCRERKAFMGNFSVRKKQGLPPTQTLWLGQGAARGSSMRSHGQLSSPRVWEQSGHEEI